MLVTANRWCYMEKSLKKTRSTKKPQEKVLFGPFGLDKISQITRFLLVVQGKDPRDPVSYLRLILVGVEFRAAGEVKSGVTGLGQDCGIPCSVVVLDRGLSANFGRWIVQGTYLDFHEVIRGHVEDSQAYVMEALQPSLASVVRDCHGDYVPYDGVSRVPEPGLRVAHLYSGFSQVFSHFSQCQPSPVSITFFLHDWLGHAG